METISLEYSPSKPFAHSCSSHSSSSSLSTMVAKMICQLTPWLLVLHFIALLESQAVFPVVASTPPSASSNQSSRRWPMTTPTHKLSQLNLVTLSFMYSVHFLEVSWPDFSRRQFMSSPSNTLRKPPTKSTEILTERESNE